MSDIKEDIAALEKALEAGPTPGPWAHGIYKGYCIDWVRTEHPDFQQEPYGAYVADLEDMARNEIAQTGNAAGQSKEADKRWPNNAAYIAACSPDRIRRLLDALKGAQAVILNGDGVVSAGVAINVQRRRAEEAEAKLSRAVELLSAVAEHGAVVYTSADGRVETLHGRIAAFLKEAP